MENELSEFRQLFVKNLPHVPNDRLLSLYRGGVLRLGDGSDWYEKVCEKEILRRLEEK